MRLKAFPAARCRPSLNRRPFHHPVLRLKLTRFAHRILLTNVDGHIVRRLHPERARALLASGDARLSGATAGRIDQIVLTNRLFDTPAQPRRYVKARNLYISRSTQDTNVPRGMSRGVWFR